MAINSRNKGASAERQLANLIADELGVRLIRNLEQSRSGGHDLIPHPDETGPVARQLARYAIECKRYSKASPGLMKGWWAQAELQSEACGLVPVLAYRADRAAWRFVLPMSELMQELPRWPGLAYTVEVSVDAFAALVRERSDIDREPCNGKSRSSLQQHDLALHQSEA